MTIYLEPPFRKYQKIGQEKVDSIPISTLAVNFRATTAQSVIQIDKQSFFPTHNADAEKGIPLLSLMQNAVSDNIYKSTLNAAA